MNNFWNTIETNNNAVNNSDTLNLGNNVSAQNLEPINNVGSDIPVLNLAPSNNVGNSVSTQNLEPINNVGSDIPVLNLAPSNNAGNGVPTQNLEPINNVGSDIPVLNLAPSNDVGNSVPTQNLVTNNVPTLTLNEGLLQNAGSNTLNSNENVNESGKNSSKSKSKKKTKSSTNEQAKYTYSRPQAIPAKFGGVIIFEVPANLEFNTQKDFEEHMRQQYAENGVQQGFSKDYEIQDKGDHFRLVKKSFHSLG